MKRKLTDTAVKNAKPGKNPKLNAKQGVDYKMADGGGLHLLVTAKGGKYWRYNYEIAGREKTKPLGVYPEVSLEAARKDHNDAHKLVKAGIDPVAEARAETTLKAAEAALAEGRPFHLVAAEWLAAKYPASRRAKSTINARRNSIAKLSAAFGDWDIRLVNKVKYLSDVLTKCENAETYVTRVNVQRDAISIMGFAVGKSKRAGESFEVPLSRQAVTELRQLQALTGDSKFLFPGRPSRWADLPQASDTTISEVTINATLGRIGYRPVVISTSHLAG
jgi:hypothetical protein